MKTTSRNIPKLLCFRQVRITLFRLSIRELNPVWLKNDYFAPYCVKFFENTKAEGFDSNEKEFSVIDGKTDGRA